MGLKSWGSYMGPRGEDLCGPGGSGTDKLGFGFFFCVDWEEEEERENQLRGCWIVNDPFDDEVSCNAFSSSAISRSMSSHHFFQSMRSTLSWPLCVNVVWFNPVTLYS